MDYIPLKTVIVFKNKLQESDNLSQPLGSFVGQEAYLVLAKNTFTYTISIGRTLRELPSLNMTTPIGLVYKDLLSDAFVERFKVDYIPTKNTNGFYQKRLNVYNPIAYQDWKVSFTSINTPTIIDDVSQKGYLDDIVIDTDVDLSHSLVSVNGVFHRTTYFDNKLYVLDGFRTFRLTGRRDVCVVDMKELGGISTIPLTSNNTTKPATWGGKSIITSPVSFLGKTVFLVIDGYFYHLNDDLFYIYDNTHLVVDTNKLLLIEQFRHNPRTLYQIDRYGADAAQSSRKYEDDYETYFLNNPQVKSSDLKTIDFQYSRLTHYHSFLVIVNNAHIYTVTKDLLPTYTPQTYYDPAKQGVSGMLRYGCGLTPSYVIWRDVYGRKTIFLNPQDNDVDLQNTAINPRIIPNLINDPITSAKRLSAKFIDYVAN